MKVQVNTNLNENKLLVAGALKKFGINQNNNSYEDLLSEGLLIVAKSYQNYDESKSKFSTHVFSQIRYMVLDYYTNQKKVIPMVDDYDLNLKSSDYSLEDEVVNRLTPNNLDSLSKAISSLKDKELDIVKKRIWEELSFSEIADIYGKSKQAIQQMFKRIMKKLKGMLLIDLY